MPSVAELTALYAHILLGPRAGDDVCEECFNLTDGYRRCYACDHGEQHLDAFVPVSYSVAREQLHHALAGYKRMIGSPARRLTVELAAVLWRFLAEHESCVARQAEIDRFELVTTVPSSDRARDESHPLRIIAGELAAPTRERYGRLLVRSSAAVAERAFDAQRFSVTRQLNGERMLLIDDTWTTGASAQSAAAALKSAGASVVAGVVIGRHLNREWRANDRRLTGLARPFDWSTCALCAPGFKR